MTRRLLAALSLTAMAFVMTARADNPPVKVDPDKIKSNTSKAADDFNAKVMEVEQDYLRKEFLSFKQELQRLIDNLKAAGTRDGREKAEILENALKGATTKGIDENFGKLIELMKGKGFRDDLAKLQDAENINDTLRKDLRKLLEILQTDNRAELLAAKRREMEKELERLKDIIRKQERVRAQTELGRRDTKDIKKDQEGVTG